MRKPSVANGLREELVARDVARSPADCVADAWALGQAAIAAYASAHGVGKRRARAVIEAMRAAGRRPSKAAGPRR